MTKTREQRKRTLESLDVVTLSRLYRRGIGQAEGEVEPTRTPKSVMIAAILDHEYPNSREFTRR